MKKLAAIWITLALTLSACVPIHSKHRSTRRQKRKPVWPTSPAFLQSGTCKTTRLSTWNC